MWSKNDVPGARRWAGLAAGIAATAVAATFSPDLLAQQAKEIKVAVIAPISGPWARQGQLI